MAHPSWLDVTVSSAFTGAIVKESHLTAELHQAIAPDPLMVPPEMTVAEVINCMSQAQSSHCEISSDELHTAFCELGRSPSQSCVLVVEDGRLLGVFTERDVVRLTAAGRVPWQLAVSEIMTREVITLPLQEFHSIFVPLNLMIQHRIRHLPVVDEAGHVLGLVTQGSLRRILQPSDLLRLRQVAEVMVRQVVTAPASATVLQVAQQMHQSRVSCVVIVEDLPTQSSDDGAKHPIGIITERDIVQFQALELELDQLLAERVMSAPLFHLHPQDSLWDAHQRMLQRRFRRMVVVDSEGQLQGILTQTNLLQVLNPLEMFQVMEVLRQRVAHLEAEKLELLQNRNLQLQQDVLSRTAELQTQAERERLLAAIAQRIRQSLQLEDVVNATVQEVQQFLRADRVLVYQFAPDWSGEIIAEAIAPGWSAIIGEQIYDTCFQSGGGTVYHQGNYSAVDNIDESSLSPCYVELLKRFQVKANLAVPIFIANRLWGLLVAHQCSQPRHWHPQDLELLKRLAVQLAIAIQQAHAFEQAQKELAERRQADQRIQFQGRLLDAVEQAVIATDLQGQIIYWNRYAEQMYGWQAQEVMGRSVVEIVPAPSVRQEAMSILQELFQGNSWSGEFWVQRRDGTPFPAMVTNSPIHDEQGTLIGVIGVSVDITTQKQAEVTLQQLNEQLEDRVAERTWQLQQESAERQKLVALVENSTDFIAMATPDGQMTYLNYAGRRLIGMTQDASIQQFSISDFHFPEDWLMLQTMVLETLKQGLPWQGEVRLRHVQTGAAIPMQHSAFPVKHPQTGEVIAFAGILRDLTERHQAEAALRESEERFRAIFEQAAVGIAVAEPSGRFIKVNQRFCTLLGYSEAEILQLDFQSVSHPADLSTDLEQHQRLLLGEISSFSMEKRFLQKQGESRWTNLSVAMVRDRHRNPLYGIGVVEDIHERKQAEESVRQSELLFRAISEQMPDGLFLLDLDDPDIPARIIYINDAVCRMHHCELEDLLGKPVTVMDTPTTAAQAEKRVARLLAGETLFFEAEHLREDGSTYQIEVSARLIQHNNRRIVLAIDRDITERKRVERAVREGQQRDRLLGAISQRIRRSLELEAILNTTVTEVRQLLSADRVLVYRLNPDGSGNTIAEAHAPGCTSIIGRLFAAEVFPSECYQPYLEGRTYALSDRDQSDVLPCLVDFMRDLDIRAKLVVPILSPSQSNPQRPDQLWGLLIAHQCAKPRNWRNWEIDLLQRLSNQLAIAIQQSELYAQLQEQLLQRENALSELKRAEQQLKASLDEKELLLKEVHHRVKNNLQVISSIFSLQSSYIQEPRIRTLLAESQDRIRSMAMIHEKLYQSTSLAKIDFTDYIHTLVSNLFASYNVSPNLVQFDLNVSDIALNLDAAIPCGLLINELVSNSLKHAFPHNQPGQIQINFSVMPDEKLRLTVRDTGRGLPPDIDLNHLDSLGLALVRAIAFQLSGHLEMFNDNGAVFQITFPKPKEKRRF